MYPTNNVPTVVPTVVPVQPPHFDNVKPPKPEAPPVTSLLVTEAVPATANGTAASLGVIGGNATMDVMVSSGSNAVALVVYHFYV